MVKWKEKPEEHDYPAAKSYLSLLFNHVSCNTYIEKLKQVDTRFFKAKDILRASELPLLTRKNYHVKKDLDKIKNKTKLSPILLIRGKERVVIADGYHRLCAVYLTDEDAYIPCRIV
jgi:hypothetical protein